MHKRKMINQRDYSEFKLLNQEKNPDTGERLLSDQAQRGWAANREKWTQSHALYNGTKD
jgi:hypothetical protein